MSASASASVFARTPQEDLTLVMRAARLLTRLYQNCGQEDEAHHARGVELEAAAQAAAQLKDLDAVMATQAAVEEWKVLARDRGLPLSSVADGAHDMQDTPTHAKAVSRGVDGAHPHPVLPHIQDGQSVDGRPGAGAGTGAAGAGQGRAPRAVQRVLPLAANLVSPAAAQSSSRFR
jgi:hypothetical protein